MFLFVPSLLHFSKKSVTGKNSVGDSPSLGEQLSSLEEGRLSEHVGWQARSLQIKERLGQGWDSQIWGVSGEGAVWSLL